MDDFGGNDDQDIKINIDVVGASQSATEIDAVAESIESVADSIDGLTKAAETALGAAETAKKAVDAASKLKMATPEETASFAEAAAKRRAQLDAARAAAIEAQGRQEALAAAHVARAVKARLDSMPELEAASARVKKIEEESSSAIDSQRAALGELVRLRNEAAAALARENETAASARAEQSRLDITLALQESTRLKPYTGPLIDPKSLKEAEDEVARLKKELGAIVPQAEFTIENKRIIDATRGEAPTRVGSSGKKEILVETGTRAPEVQKEIDSSIKALQDAAKAGMEAILKKNRVDKPEKLEGGARAQYEKLRTASASDDISELTRNLRHIAQISGEIAKIEEQVRADSARLAAAREEIAKVQPEYNKRAYDVVEEPDGTKSFRQKKDQSAARPYGERLAAAREQEFEARSSIDFQEETIALRGGRGAAAVFGAAESAKLLDLIKRLDNRPEIVSKTPTQWVPEEKIEADARAAESVLRSPEVAALRNRLARLETELAKARGQIGEYEKPIFMDGRVKTSGAPIRDPEGRSDAQLREQLDRLEKAGTPSLRSSTPLLEELDRKIAEAKVAYSSAVIDAQRRIQEAVQDVIGEIDFDKLIKTFMKEIAATMIEEFKAAAPRTDEEVAEFRNQILSKAYTPGRATGRRKKSDVEVLRGGALPPEPVPEGAARIAAEAAIGRAIQSSPALRAISMVSSREDEDRGVEERMRRLRSGGRSVSDVLPSGDLREIGTTGVSKGIARARVQLLEIEETELAAIENRTEVEAERLATIRAELREISKGGVKASGGISGLLAAIGIEEDRQLGVIEDEETGVLRPSRSPIAGVQNPLALARVSQLFSPYPSYSREEDGAVRNEEIGNPVAAMLSTRIEKTGKRGIELQTVTATGKDLAEFVDTVDRTVVNIEALFAEITATLSSGKTVKPEIASELRDHLVGLMSIMAAVQKMKIDPSEMNRESAAAMQRIKDVVGALGQGGGGVLGALDFVKSGAATSGAVSESDRPALAAVVARDILTPLITNLDALTQASKNAYSVKQTRGAGTGRADVPGVPFGDYGAAAEESQLRAIAETVTAGDPEEITKILAEAMARNLLDPDALRAMIPGEGTVGGKAKRADLKALSAEPGKFDLGNAETRTKFAEIIQGVPKIMEVLGNFPLLAELVGQDPEILSQLAEEERQAKIDLELLKQRIAAFKEYIPDLASDAPQLGDGSSRVYGYDVFDPVRTSQGVGRPAPVMQRNMETAPLTPAMSQFNRITSLEGLTPEQIQSIGMGMIPYDLQDDAARKGVKDPKDNENVSLAEAKIIAQTVLDYLASMGLQVSQVEVDQSHATTADRGDLPPLPDKAIVTVVHKGDEVSADSAAFAAANELLALLAKIPTVNRGISVTTVDSTDDTYQNAPGYSHVTRGVEQPDGGYQTYASLQVAEKMRTKKDGELVPMMGFGAIASHEGGHMAAIGGRGSVGLSRDIEPIHEAIYDYMMKIQETLENSGNNLPSEVSAKLRRILSDYVMNVPAISEDAPYEQWIAHINKFTGEYLANVMAQLNGHTQGHHRGVAPRTGTFTQETLDVVAEKFGGLSAPGREAYLESDARRSSIGSVRGGISRTYGYGEEAEAPREAMKTEEILAAVTDGLTRKLAIDKQGQIIVENVEPEEGYLVGGTQQEAGGVDQNVPKTSVATTKGLGEALNKFIKDNEAQIRARIMAGVDTWIGMWDQSFTDPRKPGEEVLGTAFDLTEVIPFDQRERAVKLGVAREQRGLGAYRGGEYSGADQINLLPQYSEEQRAKMQSQQITHDRVRGRGFVPLSRTYEFSDDYDESFKKISRQESVGAFTGEDQDKLAEIDKALKASSAKIQSLQEQIDAIYDSDEYDNGSEEDRATLRETAQGLDKQIDDLIASESKLDEARIGLLNKKEVEERKADERQYALVRESLENAIINKGPDIAGFVGGMPPSAAGIAGLTRLGGGISRTDDVLSAGIPQEIIDYALSIQNQMGGLKSDGKVIDDRIAEQILLTALANVMPELESGEMPTEEEDKGNGNKTIKLFPIERIRRNILLMQARLKAQRGQIYGFGEEEDDAVQLGKMETEGGPEQLGKIKREGGVVPLGAGGEEEIPLTFDFAAMKKKRDEERAKQADEIQVDTTQMLPPGEAAAELERRIPDSTTVEAGPRLPPPVATLPPEWASIEPREGGSKLALTSAQKDLIEQRGMEQSDKPRTWNNIMAQIVAGRSTLDVDNEDAKELLDMVLNEEDVQKDRRQAGEPVPAGEQRVVASLIAKLKNIIAANEEKSKQAAETSEDDVPDDDGSFEEDSSDTYAPVEEEKPKPKKEKKPRKKKTPAGADMLSGLITPREAEIDQAEELGVSTDELATLTPAQTEGLIRERQERDMARNAKRDEERLKTAGTRAEAARKRARKQDPRARLETPMEAQIDEGAEVGLSPDEAARVDPSVVAKRKRDADEAKIAELNAADAARLKKIHDDQQARSAAAAAREKAASDRKNAADAAKAKAKEEEAKKAEEAATKAAEAPKTAAEPTKEEYDAQVVADNAARKERVAAQRRARAAAKKAAVAAEQEAAAIESSAVESDRVAAVERATVAESQQQVPAQGAAPARPAAPAGPPAPPSRPPAPPTPPAGDGQQPDDTSRVDAEVNEAIARIGLGSKLPALEAIVARIAEEVEKMVNAKVDEGAKVGISYDRDALKSQIIESNVGGFKDLLTYLDGIAEQSEKLRSQKAMPIMGEKENAGTPAAVAQRIGNATWLPDGLKRQELIKIAEDFDKLGEEVALLIAMSRQGKLKIQQEIQSTAAGKGAGGDDAGDGSAPGGGGSGWGDEGYKAPNLENVYKGMEHLKQLSNIYRELRPQVLHLTGNIDQSSLMMQKQQQAAENVTKALGTYMNVNTGIIRSLKTQVGRAATFLFVQQIGREIATVVEHLQSGVFKFNQVLENTTVGFNTLFANTLQAATSAENDLVPAYNSVGVQIGFMKEQALTFNEALLLTSKAADNMVARIRDIANVTPFRFQPLVEASLKMKAFGFEAREIPDMVNAISNAVAALGGNDEKIDRIAYALGQMNSAGRVYQNDMMQLANAGVAGYRMLSEKMLTDLIALKKYAMGELSGLPDYVIDEMKRLQSVIGSANFVKSFGTMDQMIETLKDPKRAEGLIRNMAKRGFLMGSVAARAITEGMDRQYQGSADRLSRTMTGALSTIADLSQNFMAMAFKPLYDSVRDTIVELGQFMLKSQQITIFIESFAKNVANFVNSLKGFGPALEKVAQIFINVFVGGFGAALERGSQFGAVFTDIVDKVGSGLALIGDILSDKVGRGLATAATLGTIFAKAIMANPMIATITLIIVAISGLADAIRKNTFGFGTYLSVFVDSIKGFITIIADALATIAKELATSAISSFIASMAVAIGALMPFLTVLLGTFSLLLKVLTPFAPILGLLLGIFIAFKTATMLWQVATATLAKPIAGIVTAWNSASDAVTKYGSAVRLTADRHADLRAEKISARDYVKGDNGEVLMDKNGKPIINYNRATEKINSQGYPDPETGERATSMVAAGGKVKGFLGNVEDTVFRGPLGFLKGILTQPREKIFGAMAPDFGDGFTLRHQDSGPGHMSPVFTGQKLQSRFESFQKGGVLQDLGMQLSNAGILEIPGMKDGKLDASANKYTTAWGKNFETLVLIEREASYVMTKAFEKVEAMAARYKSLMDSGKTGEANAVIAEFKKSKEGRMILPMLMRAKGDKRKLGKVSDDEIGTLLGEFHSGGLKLSKRDMRRIETLPPEVQKLIYGEVGKRVASGDSKLTKSESEELEKVRARGISSAALKGGSVGMIQKMAAAMSNFYDVINKKTAQLIKNVPLLNKLQTVKLGGAGTGLSQIQQGEDGGYYYTGKDGNITKRRVSENVVASRRTMRGGAFGKLAGLGGMLSQGGALLGIGSASSRAAGMPNAVLAGLEMFGMGNILGPDLKQTLSQKSGLFQSLGNGIGSMIGMGVGGMIPIIGPIIGPAIGSMIGELAGSMADSIIRGSEAAVEQQKARIEANKKLGLSEEDAKAAAELQSKIDKSLGLTGEGAGGIPFIVNGVQSLPKDVNTEKLTNQLSRKDILTLYDYDKSGSIDGGTEMTNAIAAINSEIMMNLRMTKNIFEKDSAGNYIYTGEDDVANRSKATGMGYVDVPTTASSGIGATPEQYAAYDKLIAQKAAIAAGSVDPNAFAAMFPDLPQTANELRTLNLTEITNPTNKSDKGLGMNQVLQLAGFAFNKEQNASTAFDDAQLRQYLQSGKNFEGVIKQLQEAKDGGALLSAASQKLLDYATLLKVETANSYTDEFGNIREMYKGGIARLVSYDAAQVTATQKVGEDGKTIVEPGKSFTDLLGYKAVEMGTGIGGGDTKYNSLVMQTLTQIGRIDPIDAMLEAGVIKSIDEMVGWSAQQLKDALAKTVEYFDAFNKRAKELTPKVDLKSSRRELMDEFGSELGYKLFDQFFEQRQKLSALEAERKKLGGDSELSRLQMLEDATKDKFKTTTTRTYEGGAIVGSSTDRQAMPSILTTAEAAKLARIRAIDKEILATRYQVFKIGVLEDKRQSASEAIRNKAIQDEAALARFKSDYSAQLSIITTKITQNKSLTRDEIDLMEREAALRDKIFNLTEREVDLGQSLAILEGQGISISNKELLNNQALLQILARKADLQAIANKSSQSAVHWAQLEAQAKVQGMQLAEKQNDLSMARLEEMEKQNVTSFGDAAVAASRDAWWSETSQAQQRAYEAFMARTETLRKTIRLMETNLNSLNAKLKDNPYGYSAEELTKIRELVAQAQGALVGGDQGTTTAAAIQRNTSLLSTMASVAQKAYDRVKKAQQTTHDEYIKQLDEQGKAIDERYRKRTQEQTEKGLLEQLQLSGLQMRSDSADPIEAAKAFYDAKNNLAEFYIEKQKDDELKAIEDEKERYSKQFQENTDAQEQIYSASITRMQNRFEAVSKVLGMDSIPGETLNDMLRLTMTGTLPGMSEAMKRMSTTDIFKSILANAEDVATMGKQTLALGETMGNLEFGQFAAEGGTYSIPASLSNGLSAFNKFTSASGFNVFRGDNEESGLLATFMNEAVSAGLKYTDVGVKDSKTGLDKVFTGATAIRDYLKSIKPAGGFGTAEKDKEKYAVLEYAEALLSGKNTFGTTAKMAILAQRTLEQGLTDFETATKTNINMASILEADLSDEVINKFIAASGETPTAESVKKLRDMVRDTYADVLARFDLEEYVKFADSTDSRIGELSNTVDSLDDAMSHLAGTLGSAQKDLTTLDKILFGTTYDNTAPIPGIDAATEQLQSVTDAIEATRSAFESTMTNLEAYADSLQGPIGAFHQLAEAMALVAGITLPTTGTVAPTIPMRSLLQTPDGLEERMQRPVSEKYNPRGYYDGQGVSGHTNLPPGMVGHAMLLGVYDAVLDRVIREEDEMSDRLKARLKELEAIRFLGSEEPEDEYRQVTAMPVPPITEFNAELKARLAEYAAAFASSIQTVGINGAQTTVTMYNQIPITITINDAQDMNTADLAEQVEEAVGRAIRASGGSYISSPTGSISG
jgi:tape measure domain-containing protein